MVLPSGATKWVGVVLAVLVASCPHIAHAADEASSYVASVVQHPAIVVDAFGKTLDAVSMISANMAAYELHAHAAREAAVDVIVYPEFGLGPDAFTRDLVLEMGVRIPAVDPLTPLNPCLNASSPALLRNASCLAITANAVAVVNVYEIEDCDSDDADCPADGRYQWNAVVVFASDGTLIAKYHKSHIWFRSAFDQPKIPGLVSFDAIVGRRTLSPSTVTFGVFMCYDIVFPHPSTDLVAMGIRHFVYPASMNSLHGIGYEAQRLWSWVHKSTLVASDEGAKYAAVFSKGVDITSSTVKIGNDAFLPDDVLKIATVFVQ